MRNQTPLFVLVLTSLFAVPFFGSPLQAESWTDLSGTRTVEAEMVGLWNNTVVLQMTDGRRVAMPMDKLQAASRIQAQRLARAQDQQRGTLVKEMQGQAKEAAAPAPSPLPQPPPADAYVPHTKGASCQEQVQWLEDQAFAGHVLLAAFYAMPPEMQKDAAEILKSLSQAGAPMISAAHKIGDLIVTRQRWLFSYPRIEALSPTSYDKVTDLLLGIGGAARAGCDPKLMDVNALSSMPTRDWIVKVDAAIAPHLAMVIKLGQKSLITVGEEKDGITKVTKTGGAGSAVEVFYKSVDGYWIPLGAKEQLALAKEQFANADATALQVGQAFFDQMITSKLQPLLDAQTEQDFHASMENIMIEVAPAVEQLASMAGQFGATGGRQGFGRNNGFDEMSMDDKMSPEDMGMESEREREREMEREMKEKEMKNKEMSRMREEQEARNSQRNQ